MDAASRDGDRNELLFAPVAAAPEELLAESSPNSICCCCCLMPNSALIFLCCIADVLFLRVYTGFLFVVVVDAIISFDGCGCDCGNIIFGTAVLSLSNSHSPLELIVIYLALGINPRIQIAEFNSKQNNYIFHCPTDLLSDRRQTPPPCLRVLNCLLLHTLTQTDLLTRAHMSQFRPMDLGSLYVSVCIT